ncbi:MAG: diaminopimelate epimerase [Acidobacteriia bacterium]|nr:diaminopimelate epimerase [Terriglobia bacterium]
MRIPFIIPFIKAHGAGNDFLYTFEAELTQEITEERLVDASRAICHRNTGVGADGWYLVGAPGQGCHARLRLYNSDGSKAELSGNGTRCAAAILVDRGDADKEVRILTGAGARTLRLVERQGRRYEFEMDMGPIRYRSEDLRFQLKLRDGARTVTILDVGNPQCAVVVESLQFDWRKAGAEIEGHPYFPKRTNVSFFRKVDERSIEARFYERGAGPTLSSGTGSTGAAAAAMLLGMVGHEVRVHGETGYLDVRWPSSNAGKLPMEGGATLDGPIYLTGPAEIVAKGEYNWQQ